MNGIVGGGDRNAQRAAQGAVQRNSRAVVVTRSFLEFVATLQMSLGRPTRRIRVGIMEKNRSRCSPGRWLAVSKEGKRGVAGPKVVVEW